MENFRVPTGPYRCHLHNTHQKTNWQTSFLYSEKQNYWKTTTSQKFAEVRKFAWHR